MTTNENIIFFEEIIVALLLIASVVAIVARRLRLPYTVGLVLMGLVLSLLSPVAIKISPQIILALLVPPLVFEAAFHLNLEHLRRDFWLIVIFALPGVILTTLLVGGVVAAGTGLTIQIAMVFGALISATDPVSVVALFRRLGVPRRLQTLLEGESLFNDGTAIVMFNLMLSIALAGKFSAVDSVRQFLTVSGGGVLIGITLGILFSRIMSRIDDPLVETTLTTVLAFGSYLIAEYFHVSGVLAVVAAGIVNGNTGPREMSATTRVVVFNFWEYSAFIANSFVFLLIGLTIDLNIMLSNGRAILWAIIAALVARVVSIYGFSLFGREIPARWKHVLFWGGLRGAITLALALGLPDVPALAEARSTLQAMAFGVVLFTLLVQGTSTDWLVRRLKIVERTESQDQYELRHARYVAGRAAYDYLRRIARQGIISEHTWQTLAPQIQRQNDSLVDAVREVIKSDPDVVAEELDTARREALRAQRNALRGLLRDGVITEDSYMTLVQEVDAALMDENLSWPGPAQETGPLQLNALKTSDKMQGEEFMNKSIHLLMLAVVQDQDMEVATRALEKLGLPVVFLSSAGGFLGRRNATLLIGLRPGREEVALKSLEESCRQRIEYLTLPLEGSPLPMPTPVPVTVGGATVFALPVEHFEEI
jgi:monovalent cation:H+ antiporter, CPA1 family